MKHYILKTTRKDGAAYNGFKWPTEVGAKVTAPDWKPTNECGNGLHGWLNGKGDGSIGHIKDEGCIWMVLETDSYIDLVDKVKFESCTILHVGDRLSATKFLRNLVPDATRMIGESIEAGDNEDSIVGDYGIATAGYFGIATAGNRGTATAGYRGTATAGDIGTATAGHYSTATAGNGGTATAGDWGKATAEDYGKATAGYKGIATAGDWGTATAGYKGIATAGDWGTATAGDGGTIQIKYYDGNKYRILVGYIGEDGLEPNTPYKVGNGEFVKAGIE